MCFLNTLPMKRFLIEVFNVHTLVVMEKNYGIARASLLSLCFRLGTLLDVYLCTVLICVGESVRCS